MRTILKIFIIFVFLFGCSKKSNFSNKRKVSHYLQKTNAGDNFSKKSLAKQENTQKNSKKDTLYKTAITKTSKKENNMPEIIVSDTKEILKSYYEIPHIKEYYAEMIKYKRYKDASPYYLNHKPDLSKMSYERLRILKSEILANNGYLFPDGFLRGYFNRYRWYKPIFGVKDYKIFLNHKEKALYDSILAEENARKLKRFIKKDGLNLYNADLVVNTKQFANVPPKLLQDLKEQNFSISKTGRAMPFYVYDKNAYQYIPHYITTDLYLFILHRYFSKFIEKMDEVYFSKKFKDILMETYKTFNTISTKQNQEALDWAKTYISIALYTMGDTLVSPPKNYKEIFKTEIEKINNQVGYPVFIKNKLVDYHELKPRGHYTKKEELKRYFKAFKWTTINGISLKNDVELKGFITLAFAINLDNDLSLKYQDFVIDYEKLAGKEDNLSLNDVVPFINTDQLDEALSDENVKQIRDYLSKLKKELVKTVYGPLVTDIVKRVYFLSSTYSITGEIFSNLIHINWINSKRPFPRGLDIPAVFKNKTAENIIINEYKDTLRWPEYSVRLKKLQNKFSHFNEWDKNYAFKALQTALAASAEKEDYPDFMKTDAYNRKELNTTLASWTHIKHDLTLYHKKVCAAEAGEGGGPKPPVHYSYVEPNIAFWDNALELVKFLQNFLDEVPTYKGELVSIKNVGIMLRNIAQKEINGDKVTKEEFDNLHFIGGVIEQIYLNLLRMPEMPQRNRSMALITDVYSYNSTNLNVAVGHADDIYVLVPIEGEYYISRGAVFSYYEFIDDKIYNDDEWIKLVKSDKTPPRPKWSARLINSYKPLRGVMTYRYCEERDWVDVFIKHIRKKGF